MCFYVAFHLCVYKLHDDHQENDCPKKPMNCEYCELSYPKSEYTSHIDFCGSRTEQCPLCQQYIMLKDMTQHETSGCTYPEPKPTTTAPTHSDPFRMDDLQHLLGNIWMY